MVHLTPNAARLSAAYAYAKKVNIAYQRKNKITVTDASQGMTDHLMMVTLLK